MGHAWKPLCAVVSATALIGLSGCGQDAGAVSNPPLPPPTGLSASGDQVAQNAVVAWPSTDPTTDANGPSLELMITKSMLYAAGLKFHVNPYLVMGLAWHESGWQPAVISSAGAVGIMQVMPGTAALDGPKLLGRTVNLFDPGDNIEMGTALLKYELDAYDNDIAKALTAYYAGGGAVTDWGNLRADCKRYVWAVYNAAMMFKEGRGPA